MQLAHNHWYVNLLYNSVSAFIAFASFQLYLVIFRPFIPLAEGLSNALIVQRVQVMILSSVRFVTSYGLLV